MSITVEHLVKEFSRVRRKQGRFSGVRTLVSRDYESIRAVSDVSFSISPGELVGYLGPNGAGKSTTIKMLTGILTPSSGRVRVVGLDPSQLWWDLPLRESFRAIRDLYGVPTCIGDQREAEALVDTA